MCKVRRGLMDIMMVYGAYEPGSPLIRSIYRMLFFFLEGFFFYFLHFFQHKLFFNNNHFKTSLLPNDLFFLFLKAAICRNVLLSYKYCLPSVFLDRDYTFGYIKQAVHITIIKKYGDKDTVILDQCALFALGLVYHSVSLI